MSFLYPLFLAGIAAAALPIVLHMIRRHTRNRVTFSSLMFVRTTAPRFKNRSRLEHLPLLALRCIVLCLLAFAFARPFLPRPAAVGSVRPGRRMVLLIDTSASMRRAGMWDRVIDEARSVLQDVAPSDRVCVMSFDRGTQTVIGFEQWATMDPTRRASIAARNISELSPGWASTRLGLALVAAAEAMEDDEINDEQQPTGARQVVLISDLQQGGNLETLRTYEWPKGLELAVRAIPCRGTTNAALQLVKNRDPLARSGGEDLPGIRVTNSPDATRDRFQLSWSGEGASSTTGRTMDVYVPPGHSVVVPASLGTDRPAATRISLTGDDHDFDNVLYLAPQVRPQVSVLYIGSDDPNDSQEMLYYVRRAFGADETLTSRVLRRPGDETLATEEIETAHLVIVADAVSPPNLVSLRRYLESGRTLLLVMPSAGAVATLSGLAGIDNLESQEAEVDRYAMVGRMEFKHPLLAPFSDPRFGDFRRIHFWKYRRINIADCPGAEALAWFDSNDPAWFEVPVGRGSLLVWTCGWHPSDSDLALSSKFVPLLYSALEYGGTFAGHQSQYFVGDSVPVSNWTTSRSADLHIRRPDNTSVMLEPGRQTFDQTDLPGFYAAASSAGSRSFAINLSAGESRTDPMPIDDLEELGVSPEPPSDAAVQRTGPAARHTSFARMESEQKLWRWVLVSILGVLLMEIWLGGRLTRARPGPEGEQT